MEYRILVPITLNESYVNVANINRSFQKTFPLLTHADELIFDFTYTKFISAEMATLLSMYFEQALSVCKRVKVTNNLKSDIKSILSKNGFLKYYLDDEIIDDLHDTTVEFFTKPSVKFQDVDDYLTKVLFPTLSIKLSDEFTSEVSMCIFEIFHNILDHSGKEQMFICGQYYPKKDRLKIAVSDIGIGLPNRVKQEIIDQNFKNDIETIMWAFKNGHTTKNIDEGEIGGLGLSSIQDILKNRGNITLISNYGYYFISQTGIIKSKELDSKFIGTLLVLDFDVTACQKTAFNSKMKTSTQLPF